MAWLVLTISGVLEAVWAVALSKSEGFSRPPADGGLCGRGAPEHGRTRYALRTLRVGTTEATWVGIGASLAVTYDILFEGALLTAARSSSQQSSSRASSA